MTKTHSKNKGTQFALQAVCHVCEQDLLHAMKLTGLPCANNGSMCISSKTLTCAELTGPSCPLGSDTAG